MSTNVWEILLAFTYQGLNLWRSNYQARTGYFHQGNYSEHSGSGKGWEIGVQALSGVHSKPEWPNMQTGSQAAATKYANSHLHLSEARLMMLSNPAGLLHVFSVESIFLPEEASRTHLWTRNTLWSSWETEDTFIYYNRNNLETPTDTTCFS